LSDLLESERFEEPYADGIRKGYPGEGVDEASPRQAVE
jgi:hypothetical protein